MLKKTTALLFVFLLFGFVAIAQTDVVNQVKPDLVVTGEETPDMSGAEIIEVSGTPVFEPVQAGQLTWNVHNITDRRTGYDLQSNASTQEVWVDPNNPDFLHAIFTNSQEAISPWSDRTTLYFGSTDAGASWFELGPVPNTSRCGFPAIYGNSSGAAVATNHNAVFTTTHATVMIDNSPFEYNFTNWDPGVQPQDGDVIWPRHTVTLDDKVIMAGSQNGPDSFFVNVLDASIPSFMGWTGIDGEQAEQYAFAVSDNGKVGLAYNGQDSPVDNSGDVFYIESTDAGMTWTAPQKIWERDHSSDTTMGAIRGVTVTFYGEDPVVSWETVMQIFSGGNFFPGLPSNIMLWGPHLNSGTAVIVADSNNVPYAPMIGTNDVQTPICRPVLGRSQLHDYLFLAFDVATEDVFPSPDTTSYAAGYFMYSMDGGATWSDPEKYTPDAPLMDWRYPSIVPVSPTNPLDDDAITVHIVMQGDSIPGSTVNAAGMPVGVTAQYYHFSTEIVVPTQSVEPGVVNQFSLEQNYPNPFNPSTQINYTLAEKSNVSIKVYDVLGTEVATLVNTTQEAGVYDVNFDASSLASGMYVYTLKAGNFTSSKKMMLLK